MAPGAEQLVLPGRCALVEALHAADHQPTAHPVFPRGPGVLLRRADAVTVVGAALLAAASGSGHRPIAVLLRVPASTVRGWLRRIVTVADRVLAVLAAAAAQLGSQFTPPAPSAGPVGACGGDARGYGVCSRVTLRPRSDLPLIPRRQARALAPNRRCRV